MIEELGTYDLLNAGLLLYAQGEVFEAHELWEYAWGAEVGLSKLALQALIQIAAAVHKHNTGVPRGTSKLLAKAHAKIDEITNGASAWLGIDFVGLKAEVAAALAIADQIAAGSAAVFTPPLLPKRTGSDGVLYLHGFASGPSSYKAREILPALQDRGLFVAVPDLNEGDFTNLTISRALATAKRNLRERTLVIGSSLGGYLAALLAEKDERVKSLVLMAPAFEFADRMRARYGAAALTQWKDAGAIEVEHYGYKRKHAIRYALYEDALKYPQRPKLRVPAYVLQGARDDVVSPSMVEEIARAYPEQVTYDAVDDDHGLTASAHRAREAALAMIDRLRLQPDRDPPDPRALLAELEAMQAAEREKSR